MDAIEALIDRASAARTEGRFDEVRALFEEVVARLTGDPDLIRMGKLALAHSNLALLDAQRDPESARAHFGHAARLQRESAARSRNAAVVIISLGAALTAEMRQACTYEAERAEPLLEATLEQLYAHADAYPDMAPAALALADGIGVYAMHCSDNEDYERAMELGEELLEAAQRPVFTDPAETADTVIEALEVLTTAAYDSGRSARALFFGRQLVSRTRLAAQADATEWHGHHLALLTLSDLEHEAGDRAASRRLVDEAIDLDRRLLPTTAHHPLDHSAIPTLAGLASEVSEAGDLAAAHEFLTTARELVELRPGDPLVDYWRCVLAADQAAVCGDQEDIEGARRHLAWARLALVRLPADAELTEVHASREELEAMLSELEEALG